MPAFLALCYTMSTINNSLDHDINPMVRALDSHVSTPTRVSMGNLLCLGYEFCLLIVPVGVYLLLRTNCWLLRHTLLFHSESAFSVRWGTGCDFDRQTVAISPERI